MSVYQYEQARDIQRKFDPSVTTLIMAMIAKADEFNLAKIESLWPDVVAEYRNRYWSGGGLLPGEPGYDPEFDDNITQQAIEALEGR